MVLRDYLEHFNSIISMYICMFQLDFSKSTHDYLIDYMNYIFGIRANYVITKFYGISHR